NDQFFRNVLDAFGSARRQTPYLDCAPAARDLPLLQPLGATSAAGAGALSGASGESKREMTAVELLRKMIEVLEE
ncbi:MAG: hypothetical protein KDE46_12885, partial [Caldilineaceae bacterium]|nr:hypothetical protein [Caldilineaceae bacterium]